MISLSMQDNTHVINPECAGVASMAQDIQQSCCQSSFHDGTSGQVFDPSEYNVVVAYANCNHAADADRPEFSSQDGWGVNGECVID